MTIKREQRRGQWLERYREFKVSGQPVQKYCAERGINQYTFREWRQRFDREAFVEIAVPGSSGAVYSIILRNGRELQLGEGFSEAGVRKLIELLERC